MSLCGKMAFTAVTIKGAHDRRVHQKFILFISEANTSFISYRSFDIYSFGYYNTDHIINSSIINTFIVLFCFVLFYLGIHTLIKTYSLGVYGLQFLRSTHIFHATDLPSMSSISLAVICSIINIFKVMTLSKAMINTHY